MVHYTSVKHVAVIGGGPAGAVAAAKLAAAGIRATVFDEKLAWEKPCGGGLTARAYHEYPFLIDNDTPKKMVRQAVLSVPGEARATLELPYPMLIYSRYDLNRMLLDRAAYAGAGVEKTRVVGLAQTSLGWRIQTRNGDVQAEFCILPNGARNSFRNLGVRLTAEDVMLTQGYLVPGQQDHLEIVFLPRFEGYIWTFGVCT